jgi:hypothetical protein
MKLDIGCGDKPKDGFVAVDAKCGKAAYPLTEIGDGTVEEIYASHVLEHFSHRQVSAVLSEWVRVLAPGGMLRVAVPDFRAISSAYLSGHRIPVQGYVMGGHVDNNDHHGCLFDAESLTDLMHQCGLVAVGAWKSDNDDCSSLPISLNLCGVKPPMVWPKVAAVISIPRLGFNDMWGCAITALGPIGIPITRVTGAYWDQCLTRGIMEALESGPEWILTLDYDTVFTAEDVRTLLILADRNKHADALAALQSHRSKPTVLLTIGNGETKVPMEDLHGDIMRVDTAHFGLTLIRASSLSNLPKPWFKATPDINGDWGDGRVDSDIAFWHGWKKAGKSLYVANRVPVGHIEPMIRWPGCDLQAIMQHPNEFNTTGKPDGVWQ